LGKIGETVRYGDHLRVVAVGEHDDGHVIVESPEIGRKPRLWYIPPVHSDLERLIQLQALDSGVAEARRLQVTIPETQRALDDRLEGARAAVATAKERLAANNASRRDLEKDIAAIQTRLSRYKDQLMEVKTNREYHAMQHEIDTAQGEVKRLEDQMLELMVAGDDVAAGLKSAESALKTAEQQIVRDRADLGKQLEAAAAAVEQLTRERSALAASVAAPALALYEQVARGRKGVAVAVARDERCSECHVRLRPQVYQQIRQNNSIIQCDSCQRVLYFIPPKAEAAAAPTA
jgi:predicted  nucleic acid-binding Zn-ribbon protein